MSNTAEVSNNAESALLDRDMAHLIHPLHNKAAHAGAADVAALLRLRTQLVGQRRNLGGVGGGSAARRRHRKKLQKAYGRADQATSRPGATLILPFYFFINLLLS